MVINIEMFFKLSFKTFGNINEILLENLNKFYFIANDDCLPKGGFTYMNILYLVNHQY